MPGWAHDAASMQALYGEPVNRLRAANGLPPLQALRDHVHTAQPWLATDPLLDPPRDPRNLQTGPWILPDHRPLPAALEAFLDAGPPPVYIGFGSIPMRPKADIARIAINAARNQDRRIVLAAGWADLAPVDAAWLFEWTDPSVPSDWHGVLNKERGTVVYVRR